MRRDSVPQEDANLFEGKTKMLKYATDEKGSYTRVGSVGWEPENIVLSQAWEDIHEKVEEVKQKVLNGELSPLAYFMEKEMMNIPIIADYMGYWKIRVKMHLRPWFFKRLSESQINKYASVLRIQPDDLKHFRI